MIARHSGIGEIGITGGTAAIANAVYHATGKRVRELPVTLDKPLQLAENRRNRSGERGREPPPKG